MRNWDEIEESGHCTSAAEYERVQRVCQHLDIECVQVDFIKEYWNHVFEEFLRMYEIGLTPNPDSLCNQHIKFDAFLRHAVDRLGADYIATGHYCNIGVLTPPEIMLPSSTSHSCCYCVHHEMIFVVMI